MMISKKELVELHLKRAKSIFKTALILFENNDEAGVANRAYYAAFNTVKVLFEMDNVAAHKHSTVHSQFHLFYIKSGKIDVAFGKIYDDLFKSRLEGDYGPVFEPFEIELNKMIEDTDHFIREIESYIHKQFETTSE